MPIKSIPGGVCAAQGFKAAGLHCGVRKNRSKKDVALIVADHACTAAAVYTKNQVKASPLLLTKEHLAGGKARAVIANSGNANACAPNGMAHARACAEAVAQALAIDVTEVAVASTGVIGMELNAGAIILGVPALVLALSADGSGDAAEAIMTTDLKKKECAVETVIGGRTVRIGGIAKGSGMIHPNMGTMLSFITTDCAIARPMLDKALLASARATYNRVSVDGDTSTNDMCVVMASGDAGNAEIAAEGADFDAFCEALDAVNTTLARAMAKDGEGATKLVTVTVCHAPDEAAAEALAKSVVSSSLVKSAMFGGDANWGRVLCAMGYTDTPFDPEKTNVWFASAQGEILVCKDGTGVAFDEAQAASILKEDEVEIRIAVGAGNAAATVWGCDLTYEYVRINGDYRT